MTDPPSEEYIPYNGWDHYSEDLCNRRCLLEKINVACNCRPPYVEKRYMPGGVYCISYLNSWFSTRKFLHNKVVYISACASELKIISAKKTKEI